MSVVVSHIFKVMCVVPTVIHVFVSWDLSRKGLKMAKQEERVKVWVEPLDPTPVEVPVGFQVPETTEQIIARMVNSRMLASAAMAQGYESPEEADDFDIPDDPLDRLTPYEEHFFGEFDRVFEKKAAPPQPGGGVAAAGSGGSPADNKNLRNDANPLPGDSPGNGSANQPKG